MHSELYCPLPFMSLTIHPTNKLTHCMMSETTMSNIKENDGWNNLNFQNMRSNMLKNIWNTQSEKTSNADCGNCKEKETRGLFSQRQNWLTNLKHMFPENTYEQSKKLVDNEIYHLNLNLSNICNFKCRMCSPNYSTALIPDFIHLNNRMAATRRFDPQGTKQIIDLEEILCQYGKQLSPLQSIWVTGGEPFMDDRLYDFAENLKNYTDVSKININITTNGSKLDIHKLKVFNDYKTIGINLSVDGTGKLFEYMRSAGVFSWEEMLYNLEEIDFWQITTRKSNHRVFSVNASFQIYNCYDTYNFFKFFLPYMKKWDWIEYRLLTNPYWLAAQHLPDYIKTKVNNQLESLIDYISVHDVYKAKKSIQFVKNCINCLKTPRNQESWEKFVDFTVVLDLYRKQYFYDACPDFYADLNIEDKSFFQKLYKEKNV